MLASAGGAVALAALGAGALDVTRVRPRDRLPSRIARLPGYRPRPNGVVRAFNSRPDLRPPAVAVSGARASNGYLFIAPEADAHSQPGPLVLDHHGEPIWFKPFSSGQWATNVMASRYRDQPVLIWWEGKLIQPGYGRGEGVIVDTSYRELARVRAGNGRDMDLHEFRLTPEGTALITCYPETVTADLTAIGGPKDGRVQESVIQEIDVRTGELLLEWRGLEHVPLTESYATWTASFDYLHANSIEVMADGNLLVCARHTWALYKLDRRNGQVIWRLGGKRSDFHMAPGSRFSWAHDARLLADGSITLFDDGSNGPIKTESQSRAIVLDVDERGRKVRLARAYHHPGSLLAGAMGNIQALPDGRMLVGWGSEPYVTEFDASGRIATDVHLASGRHSYRAYRLPWTGSPAEPPVITAHRDRVTGKSMLYASWNGATEVTHWQVSAGPSSKRLVPVGLARRQGFETLIPLGRTWGHASVTALDRHGRPLAASPPVRLQDWA